MKDLNRPLISAIVAMAENRVIGKNNQLLWHLPADFKHFKATTTGHPILMGRKTYESIGKPLPNRTNIIITRKKEWTAPGCIIVASINDAIKEAANIDQQEIFIIGGAEIFQQALSLIQRIYLTIVHYVFDGDTYFPELDKKEWKEVIHETHSADQQNPYSYSFLVLERV